MNYHEKVAVEIVYDDFILIDGYQKEYLGGWDGALAVFATVSERSCTLVLLT